MSKKKMFRFQNGMTMFGAASRIGLRKEQEAEAAAIVDGWPNHDAIEFVQACFDLGLDALASDRGLRRADEDDDGGEGDSGAGGAS